MNINAPQLPVALARWYATQSSVRRLWAVDDSDSAISVFVTLEPTYDGDDALPVWLAKSDDWANELSLLAQCEVRLKLLEVGAFEQARAATVAATIAELSWRDPWTSS